MPLVQSQGRSPKRESKAPKLPWGRALFFATVLFACSAGGLEAYWRAQGVWPQVPDSVALWSYWRRQVYEPAGSVLVFLGTSRVRADIDLETLSHALPAFRCVQLGVNGNVSPIGTLRSLADDPEFRGIVICELAAPFLQLSRWDDQHEYFGRPWKSRAWEQPIGAWLRDKVVLLNPRVTLSSLLCDRPRPPSRARTCFDRSQQYENSGRDPDPAGLQLDQQKPLDPGEVRDGLRGVRELVHSIRARGGSVVFVGLPASADSLEGTNGFTGPFTLGRIAELTGAVCISEEGDSLGRFRCPDGVHLDPAQAKRLTHRLVAELYRNRVVEIGPYEAGSLKALIGCTLN